MRSADEKDRRLLGVLQSKFLRNVVQVLSGSALANLAMLGALPLLTRIYAPSEFGVFAIYLATSMILSGLACAKYELAIPLPASDSRAWHTLLLTMLVSTVVPLFTAIVLLFWTPAKLAPLGTWLFLLPIGVLLDSLSRSFSFWLTRNGKFAWLACVRMSQVVTVVFVQVYGGANFGGDAGLVIGFFSGIVVLFSLNAWKTWQTRPQRAYRIGLLSVLAKEYQQFPRFLLLAHSGATLSSSLPVFFFATFHGDAIAGLFAVAMRVIDRPVQLIGQAVFQVFYPEASRQYLQHGECRRLFSKTVRWMFIVGVCLLLAIVLFAPNGVSWLLGERWADSGRLIQLLAPMLVLQLMHTPVSGLFMIAEKQHLDLVWTFLRLALVVLGLSFGLWSDDPLMSVVGLSVAGSLAYGIHLYLSYRFSLGNPGHRDVPESSKGECSAHWRAA